MVLSIPHSQYKVLEEKKFQAFCGFTKARFRPFEDRSKRPKKPVVKEGDVAGGGDKETPPVPLQEDTANVPATSCTSACQGIRSGDGSGDMAVDEDVAQVSGSNAPTTIASPGNVSGDPPEKSQD